MVQRENTLDLLGHKLGSYRVKGLLGVGGMGAVFLAEHEALGRKAAIKVLHPEFAVKPKAVERFFHEAKAANMVEHPSIVDIYDYGTSDFAGAYIVMEYLNGENLGDRIEREKVLSETSTVHILTRVCNALGAAHRRGLVHRDMKPDNIFLVPDPDHPGDDRVKVLDFGIAKLIEGEVEGGVHTRTGTVVGTPTYMSPEQCHGGVELDHRSDIYSLGIIAFEMLTGRPPFVGQGAGQIYVMHMTEAPPTPRSVNENVSESVQAAVLQALQKEKEERFDTADAFAAALRTATGLPTLDAAPPPARSPSDRVITAENLREMGVAPTLATPISQDEIAAAAAEVRAAEKNAAAPARPLSGEWGDGVVYAPTVTGTAVDATSKRAKRPSTLSASAVELEEKQRGRRGRGLTAVLAGAALLVMAGVGVSAYLFMAPEAPEELTSTAVADGDETPDRKDKVVRPKKRTGKDGKGREEEGEAKTAGDSEGEDEGEAEGEAEGEGEVDVEPGTAGTGDDEGDASGKEAGYVVISLDSAPGGAAVFEMRSGSDGVPKWLGKTPMELTLTREPEGERAFLIRLAGYKDEVVNVRLGEDWKGTVRLKAPTPPKPKAAPKASPKKPATKKKPGTAKAATAEEYDPDLPD